MTRKSHPPAKKVGVLALQGDVSEHTAHLESAALRSGIKIEIAEIRSIRDMPVAALIIPGGESTTIGKLLERTGLRKEIENASNGGIPILGTCAGMVLLARKAVDGLKGQPLLGVMDITVKRNAFGRQKESFEADVDVRGIGKIRGVFIRAPCISKAGKDVGILSVFDKKIIGARQGNRVVLSFHPELTSCTSVYEYFLKLL